MATGSPYSVASTQAAKWVASVYAKRVDRLAYELSKLMQRCNEEEPLRGGLHIPKFDNLTVASYSDSYGSPPSTYLYEPVFQSNAEGEITISPTYYDCNVAIEDRLLNRMIFDPRGEVRTGIELALSQQADINIATQFASFVGNFAGDYVSDLTLATILHARSLVLKGGKEYAEPGNLVLGYHTDQDDAVMGISPLVQWIARGDTGNAAKTGVLGEGFGISFVPTTVIRNSGGGYNNAMIIKRAVSYSFNIRPSTKLQDHGNAKWLLGQMDMGVSIARDQYGCLVKSQAS